MGIGSRVFQMVHMRNLVYNTCWEDPRLDRVALELGPDENVLVITSAGCNALDYALTRRNIARREARELEMVVGRAPASIEEIRSSSDLAPEIKDLVFAD